MSSNDSSKNEQMTAEKRLEYLRFVEMAAVQIVLVLGRIYDFAKDMTGPLKSVVESFEGRVKAIGEPLYKKALEVPYGVLMYADSKVAESVTVLGHHLPPELMLAAHVAPFAAQSISSEYRRAGFFVAASSYLKYMYYVCEPKAQELYSKYEPIVEQNVVFAWRKLERIPLFPMVAQFIFLPIAALFTKMYNETVKSARMSSVLPLVPIEKIIKVFNEPALAFN